MSERTYYVVFEDRRPDWNGQAVLTVTCQGMEFWKADGFWEFRFLYPIPDPEGNTTFFLRIREDDLMQVIGQNCS